MVEKKFDVKGMHCASCEHVVGKILKNQKGVRTAVVDRSNDQVTLDVNDRFSFEKTNAALVEAGYSLESEVSDTNSNSSANKVWWTLFLSIIFVGLVWFVANGAKTDLFDPGKMVDNVSITSAFILGLIASISSCLAVTGGLILAMTANIPDKRKWNFSISFGIGRLLSYGILGGLLGLIGEKIAISSSASAILTFIVSIIMILLGLQLLGLIKVPSIMPKGITKRIENMTQSPNKTAIGAGIVGALTFFLPCAFTQALQLFALQSGSFVTGGSILFVFALGTLPVLMFVGSVTKYIGPSFRKYALVAAGIIVIVLGAMSISHALTLYSASISRVSPSGSGPIEVPSDAIAAVQNGNVQEISMKVNGYAYEPDTFTLKAGVPVKWTIDARKAAGCARSLVSPNLGIRKVLSSTSDTIVEFTPTTKGEYQFTCSMGMAGPGKMIVI